MFLAFLLIFAPQGLKAEQSGWFVGVQGGYNKLRWEKERETAKYASTQSLNETYRAYFETNRNGVENNKDTLKTTYGWDGTTPLVSEAVRKQLWTAAGATDTANRLDRRYKKADGTVCDASNQSTCNVTELNELYFSALDNILSPYWQTYTNNSTSSTTTTEYTYDVPINDDFNGFTAGLLGGYKQFFGGSFDLRFYGILDFGYYRAKNKTIENQMQSYAASFNADMLYNLYENDDFAFGIFGGLNAGWTQYAKGGDRLGSAMSFGVNLGLRLNLSVHHSIEFFSKINTIGSNDNFSENSDTQTANTVEKKLVWNSTYFYTKLEQGGVTTNSKKERIVDSFKPATQVGIRYVYSF